MRQALLFLLLWASFATAEAQPNSLYAHWKFDSILDDFTDHANHLQDVRGYGFSTPYGLGRDSTLPNRSAQLFGNALQVITYYWPLGPKELQVDSADRSWSVAAWVLRGGGTLISNINTITYQDSVLLGYEGQFAFSIRSDSSAPYYIPRRIRAEFLDNNGNLHVFKTDTVVTRFKWHHLVWVVDKAADSLFIYFNGKRQDGFPLPPNINQVKSKLTVGASHWPGYDQPYKNYLGGYIDDMKIYMKALKQSEVLELYENNAITSINPIEEEPAGIEIYPNPTQDQFRILSEIPITAVNIYDVRGALFLRNELHTTETVISTSELSAGHYVILIETENGIVKRRMIKNASR